MWDDERNIMEWKKKLFQGFQSARAISHGTEIKLQQTAQARMHVCENLWMQHDNAN